MLFLFHTLTKFRRCAKRDLGSIGGFPRLINMKQYNDAYNVIKVACTK
jgi:hydroxylamine reductase (hybrid-cluster protein)